MRFGIELVVLGSELNTSTVDSPFVHLHEWGEGKLPQPHNYGRRKAAGGGSMSRL